MLSVLTYVVSENAPFSTKYFLILLMSAFFLAKKSAFFGKNGIFTLSNIVLTLLEIV